MEIQSHRHPRAATALLGLRAQPPSAVLFLAPASGSGADAPSEADADLEDQVGISRRSDIAVVEKGIEIACAHSSGDSHGADPWRVAVPASREMWLG
jgi:hypothetical protein